MDTESTCACVYRVSKQDAAVESKPILKILSPFQQNCCISHHTSDMLLQYLMKCKIDTNYAENTVINLSF